MPSPNAKLPAASVDHAAASGVRTGLNAEDLKQSFLDSLFCGLGRVPMIATRNDLYTALALAVRDRILKQWVGTMETYAAQVARIVVYLSAEFLPGPHLANNLSELGIKLDDLFEQGEEPGLGNGGLGRH